MVEIKKTTKRLKNTIVKQKYLQRKAYVYDLRRRPVRNDAVLFESQHGTALDGNIFALLKCISENPSFAGFSVYLACEPEFRKTAKEILKNGNVCGVTLVKYRSFKYFRILATAGYLVNDNTFLGNFVKRPEQIYLNTWHGTPLKTLGKAMKSDYGSIGNAERNMLMSDYLLCPNEFTRDVFIRDYMLENISDKTKLLLTGYPRNEVFFSEDNRNKVREKFGFGEKKIYAYLPTWRGIVGGVCSAEQNSEIRKYLAELDELLPDDGMMFVKLHPLNALGMDLKGFRHIFAFPENIDTYTFLNATDALVTDYSSVMFDYSLSNRKVVLFTYDEEKYTKERGLYFPLTDLPFERAKDTKKLAEILAGKNTADLTEFKKKFTCYDRENVSEAILKKVFFNEESGLIKEEKIPDNGKENIFIYPGGLEKNGVTTSIVGLLNNVDTGKFNFILAFRINEVKKNEERLKDFPETIAHMGYLKSRSMTLLEEVFYMIRKKTGVGSARFTERALVNAAKLDNMRVFGGCRVDTVVQFSGYGDEITVMLQKMPCNRIIYSHNDMASEAKTRKNVDLYVLARAYRSYESVACVTKELIPIVTDIADNYAPGGRKPNAVEVKNIIDDKKIREMSEHELKFDADTEINHDKQALLDVLNSDTKVFVTIGRFSPEKGHRRFIEAFERLKGEGKDIALIILGGHGKLYDEVRAQAAASRYADSIFIIKSMSNPYALLKKCDYFVLPSYYEGFGLVLAEADICGLPCISTNIVGPRDFMTRYGGKMCDDSRVGIFHGMKDCLENNVPKKLNVDYDEYNKECAGQFVRLL